MTRHGFLYIGIHAAVDIHGADRFKFFDGSFNSPVIIANAWHHRSDAISSVAALIGILGAHLDILVDVLEHAEDHIWSTSVSLILDRMGIKRKAAAPNSIELELQELQGVKGGSLIPLRVRIPRSEFPEPGDFLAEAQRLLG